MKTQHTPDCREVQSGFSKGEGYTCICDSSKPQHTPTPMGWVTSVMHESTRTLKEVAHFAGPNAGRVLRAVNAHEELLRLIKTAYCIVAEAMPEQAPDPSAFVVVQKDWLKRTEQAIAKAESR